VLLVPKIYGEIVAGFDIIILTISLLFRKSKGWKERSSLDRRGVKLLGYYATGSAIALLVLNHFVSFTSLLDYYAGLLIDALLFYTGLKVITHE
jgi:divalent metal cation (Fe/Co/Zn/Cd) transporter